MEYIAIIISMGKPANYHGKYLILSFTHFFSLFDSYYFTLYS